jgi:soluble lytic murein transglycosylase-like protein
MAFVSRTLALLTIALAIVLVTHFSATPSVGPVAAPRLETLASVSRLPDTWTDRVVPSLAGLDRRASDAEMREIVRIVERASARAGVDPLLVLSVIQVESRFDRTAVSPQGAMGLMQIRPETAGALAAEIGLEWSSDELLFDPEVNVLLGTLYLSRLQDRFQDLDAALAAFHAGPTRIESRLARSEGFSLRYADRVWSVLFRLQAGALA